MLERSIAVCEKETHFSYGSDTCVVTALYLYRQGLHELAIDVLMHSCKRENLRACVYILGLPPAPGPLQAKALRLYCGTDVESPKVKTEPGVKMGGEKYLNCTGVTTDTENISRENILLSWDELKRLDKTF